MRTEPGPAPLSDRLALAVAHQRRPFVYLLMWADGRAAFLKTKKDHPAQIGPRLAQALAASFAKSSVNDATSIRQTSRSLTAGL